MCPGAIYTVSSIWIDWLISPVSGIRPNFTVTLLMMLLSPSTCLIDPGRITSSPQLTDADADWRAVEQGYVSVTPLRLNSTDEDALHSLKATVDGDPGVLKRLLGMLTTFTPDFEILPGTGPAPSNPAS